MLHPDQPGVKVHRFPAERNNLPTRIPVSKPSSTMVRVGSGNDASNGAMNLKTFKVGDVSPFTCKPLAKGEFPCGWAHHVAIFCGYSVTAELKWTGGWTHDPAVAERRIRDAGLVPMDGQGQLGWVPPHLR